MAIKLLIFTFLIATTSLSQSLCIRLVPSICPFFGIFQTKVLENNKPSNLQESKLNKLGNIGLGSISYSLDLTFLKYKKYIFGANFFNSSGTYGSSAYYTTTSNYIPTPVGNATHIEVNNSIKLSNIIYNFGIYSGVEFSKKTAMKLAFLFQSDKTNISEESSGWPSFMYDGLFTNNHKIVTKYMNKKSIGLNLSLERTIFTKKNRNILTLKASYSQGFRIMGSMTSTYTQYPLNYKMVINSFSKGSGFFIGLAKTINVYEKSN